MASSLKWDRHRPGEERTEGHQKGRSGGPAWRPSGAGALPCFSGPRCCPGSARDPSRPPPHQDCSLTEPSQPTSLQVGGRSRGDLGTARAETPQRLLPGDCSPFALRAQTRAWSAEAGRAQIPPAGQPGEGVKPAPSERFSRLR